MTTIVTSREKSGASFLVGRGQHSSSWMLTWTPHISNGGHAQTERERSPLFFNINTLSPARQCDYTTPTFPFSHTANVLPLTPHGGRERERERAAAAAASNAPPPISMSSYHHPKAFSSPEVSSLPMAAAGQEEAEGNSNNHLHRVVEEGEEEAELELGLSLGVRMGGKVGRGGSSSSSASSSFPCAGQWGEYCRILTAKDFPSSINAINNSSNNVGASRRVSSSSSSVSSSSSSSMGGGLGSKRAAADPVPQSQMVGWPPIRASRINSLFNHAKDNSPAGSPDAQNKKPVGVVAPQSISNSIRSIAAVVNGTQNHEKKKPKTFFVKVNMDGMPIGRKVDLNAHRSYESLAFQLEDMFQNNPKSKTNTLQIVKTSKLLDGSSEFVLTYEDKDGDWMLVGDVPWGMFLSTVRRLRIMRTTDANGLAPRIRSQG